MGITTLRARQHSIAQPLSPMRARQGGHRAASFRARTSSTPPGPRVRTQTSSNASARMPHPVAGRTVRSSCSLACAANIQRAPCELEERAIEPRRICNVESLAPLWRDGG
eukprot:5089999-Pleurochrysis_carterae.AAC.4